MDREEFEGRSQPDLIGLILRQQDQIADLQAQVAQLQLAARRNGDAQDALALAGSQVVPIGRFPPVLRLVVIASLALICVIGVLIATFRPGALIGVGTTQDFAPGSVTFMQLPSPNRDEQAIPIFLVNDSAAGFLALSARAPGSNCLLAWNVSSARIEDPCSRSKFTRTGEVIDGPVPRGLDHYVVNVTESGEIQVDVSTLKSGPVRP